MSIEINLSESPNFTKPNWNVPFYVSLNPYTGIEVKVKTEALKITKDLRDLVDEYWETSEKLINFESLMYLSEKLNIFERVLQEFLSHKYASKPICEALNSSISEEVSHYYKEFLLDYPSLGGDSPLDFKVLMNLNSMHSINVEIHD